MVRQTGLGKGLGALIPGDDEEQRPPPPATASTAPAAPASSTTATASTVAVYQELSIDAIRANEYQPREQFDEEALDALTASIREVGVLQPVLVRPGEGGEYELIAGERRWRASRRAGLDVIPAIIRQVEDLGALEQALVENLHRQDLGPLEEAAAYAQLMEDFGLNQEQVGQRVGKSRSAISNALRLMQLPAAVQAMLVDGELTAGHARALLGLPSKQDQEKLARRIVERELSVREVEAMVRDQTEAARRVKPAPRRQAPQSAAVLEVEQTLADHLDTSVSISVGEKRSKLIIDFADLDDLSRIYDLLMGD